jgi:serine/threonine protein kinase/Tfp pilus assembly protein PilF
MSDVKADAKAIFLQALEHQSPDELRAFLDDACCGDAALRARAEELLHAHQDAGNFLGGLQSLDTTQDEPLAEGPGTQIGPYKLLEQIGEGGMGLVYVAEQQEPIQRRVALKIIKPGMDSRQVIARFEAERQALALMDHPNIAKVHDGGATPEGRPYFVMEWVKGTPITDYCDTHRLTTLQRLQLFLDVCHAVQHAHQKGIIHRDIKPSNVLVEVHDVQPVVKVIDFGIAKAIGQQLTEKTVYTGVAQMIGTPLYMSPEQAGLSSLDVDTRSDVYSLGVLLYVLLTGTTPFDSETFKHADYDEMRRIIREVEPLRPSTRFGTIEQVELSTIAERRGLEPRQLIHQLRGELDWIVMKALEKDRNRRYESASAFSQDVQRYLNDEPVTACPPSKLYQLGKFARRHKVGLGVAALLLVVWLMGGSSWLWWVQKQEVAAGEARVAIQEANDHLEAERWSEARSAARRAEGVLAAVGGNSGLRREVREVIEDLEMGRRLQEAKLRATSEKAGRFDWGVSAQAYAEAFRDYGLEVDGLDSQTLATRIQVRAIHRRLVMALDDWAVDLLQLKAEGWRQRLALARAADPDGWRNRLRDALEGKDPKAVEELVSAGVKEEWPVQTLELLVRVDSQYRSHKGVVALLAQAQRRHPEDFWINLSLGQLLKLSRPRRLDDEIRFWSIAVALQPQSPGAHINLGVSLEDKGQLDEAIDEFREAIRLKKDSALAHCNLGIALKRKGQLDEGIAECREAVRLNKDSAPAHCNLGTALRDKGQLDEAIAEHREAIRINKDYAEAHNNLGVALKDKGRLDEAIAEVREAIRIDKDYAEAHANLGAGLADKGQLDEVIAEYREAIRLKKDSAEAHDNLGIALQHKGRLDEAIAEWRKAILLKEDYAEAHYNLGNALRDKGQLDEAIAEYSKASRLKKDDLKAHVNLGVTLLAKGRLDEAIAEFREGVRINKDHHFPHYNLGNALRDKGLPDEAIAEYRETVRLNKDYAEAHCNLGNLLQRKGQFKEAVEELSRGHQLGLRSPSWPYPSAQWLLQAEQLAQFDERLSAVLEGKGQPKDAAERIVFAQLCTQFRKRYAAAARWYGEAFAEKSQLADDLRLQCRYNAACAAALASCGQGVDADKLDAKERARLRQQALDWLRADLKAYRLVMEKSAGKAGPAIAQRMQHWLQDKDFIGVRDSEALAKLPEAERKDWQKLWEEVEALLQQAAKQPKQASSARP